MTPFELLDARAELGAAIGMTLQEWRELTESISELPTDEQAQYDEVIFYRQWHGKVMLIATEPA